MPKLVARVPHLVARSRRLVAKLVSETICHEMESLPTFCSQPFRSTLVKFFHNYPLEHFAIVLNSNMVQEKTYA